jgi:peptide-methionine (S)-S-oxide reductase
VYQEKLNQNGLNAEIQSEIILNPGEYYYAEDYHQQYLAKNPGGYCTMQGVGVECKL